jgi:alanyl-tRNA synthetase
MKTAEVREKYLSFFKKRGHEIMASASLVPQNDPTTLFTGSGMQPMIPYLLGEKHPLGTRITDSQKSFRSGDIDDIGDNRHTTFFEMLGNWSLGDYFKKEQVPWMFEFLTKEIGIDPKKLYITVLIGDDKNNIPKDTETAEIWKELFAEKGIEAKEVEIGTEQDGYEVGMQGGRIFYYDVGKNWWSRVGVPDKMPPGEPGGPDTEMFYEFTDIPHDLKYGKNCHPNCDCGRFMEIGNNVFMEYKKNADGTFSKLPQSNVDFGGGLERITAASLNTADVFQIDIFKGIIETLEKLSGKSYIDSAYTAAFRIIADHIRSAIFLIGDGVYPSNADQGYFVRRLLRRAIRYWDKLGIDKEGIAELLDPILEYYKEAYADTYNKKEAIKGEIQKEEQKFRETLERGMKEFEKGIDAFTLFTTYGFPIELTVELAKEKGVIINREEFDIKMKGHQDLSRSGSEQKFRGGLADHSRETVRLHTAHHLLLAALQNILGPKVKQRGSNITAERLRIDFSFERKMTDEEKKKVEDLVNSWITEKIPMIRRDMPKAEAEALGAEHEFGATYGDTVSVYFAERPDGTRVSKEFCGGPHVTNTDELSHFKILKEEAVAAGIRRIKAVLE